MQPNYTRFFLITVIGALAVVVRAQSTNWQIYAGPSMTNTMHIVEKQQIVWLHSINSPRFRAGWIVGASRIFNVSSKLDFGVGIEFVTKGDNESRQQVAPIDTIYGLQLLYGSIPFNIAWRLLPRRKVYLKVGISGEYLLSANELAWWVNRELELSGHLRCGGQLFKHWYAELGYSEGFESIAAFDNTTPKIKHQAIELRIIYRL